MAKNALYNDLNAAIERLQSMTWEELLLSWEQAHGKEPPKAVSRRLLEYSAGYQLQVKACGSLTTVARRKLEVNRSKKSSQKLQHNMKTAERGGGSKPLALGSRLIREWHGVQHVVQVTDSGYRYDGVDYKSLSRIARKITGARWSGPRFFGV